MRAQKQNLPFYNASVKIVKIVHEAKFSDYKAVSNPNFLN